MQTVELFCGTKSFSKVAARLGHRTFTLDNDPALIPPLMGYLKDSRFRVCGSDETGLVRITMALREAVLNALAFSRVRGLREPGTRNH